MMASANAPFAVLRCRGGDISPSGHPNTRQAQASCTPQETKPKLRWHMLLDPLFIRYPKTGEPTGRTANPSLK
jgi:hypothetical protein